MRDAEFARWSPLVRPIALSVSRMLPRSIAVEDLMQTGNLALLHAIDARDPAQPEAAWVCYLKRRIMGAMLDSVRGPAYRESTHLGLDDVVAAIARAAAPDASLDEQLDLAARRRAVWLAVDSLPDPHRRVLRLRYMAVGVELLTQAQVAEQIGVSQVMVSRYERQAIAQLRDRLAPAGDERDEQQAA